MTPPDTNTAERSRTRRGVRASTARGHRDPDLPPAAADGRPQGVRRLEQLAGRGTPGGSALVLLSASAITLLMLGAFVLALMSHYWIAAIVALLALGAGLIANPLSCAMIARSAHRRHQDGDDPRGH